MSIYAMICKDFGRKFTFTAKNFEDAISKAKSWCRYHSYCYGEDITTEKAKSSLHPSGYDDLHNEYLR